MRQASPRRSEFLFLKQEMANFIKLALGLIVGAGIAYAPGAFPKRPTGWNGGGRSPRAPGEARFVTHDLNPDSLNYYDYTSREWFMLPSSQDSP